MTLRKIALFAVALPVLAGFFACNSSTEPSTMTISSAAVKSFSLTKDDSVMAHLDSVFFSIDLTKGLIFNADSLPFGTDVSRIIPVITTLETASAVELKVKRANGTDTTYNYLSNSTDSIDFTNPVTLRVVSYDGLNEVNYTVKVNVHKMVSDSLTWLDKNRSALPTAIAAPVAQRTALCGDTYYCLTAGEGKYSIASYTPSQHVTNNTVMEIADWDIRPLTFPFTPLLESFSATDDALFILAEDGTLYSSTDNGADWAATSFKWHAVYGRYGRQLLGSVETADGWFVQSYPSGTLIPVPENMPVEGSSTPVYYTFPMSGAEQMVIVGGRAATGRLSRDAWGFDGTAWADLSMRSLPVALEGMAVASYFSFKTLSSQNVLTYPSLIAFGGRDESGKVNSTVYISDDYGVNWQVASQLMQLPEYMEPLYGAQTFVVDSYYSSMIQPAIAKPVETWECPYIYMFGGYTADGSFSNSLWRGVINRLSFKPIE